MKKKETNYFFETFIELFKYTKNAAMYLDEVISNFENGITDE